MWNGLDDQQKQKFQLQAAELKEKHYREHPDWKWSSKEKKRYEIKLGSFPKSEQFD